MSKFPSIDRTFLMICDDFRHEGDGKLSIFGVLSDTALVNASDTKTDVGLQSLGIYIAFRDGLGKFKMTMKVTNPKQVCLVPEDEARPVEKKADGWMNIALKIQPFRGPLGIYTVQVILEDDMKIKNEYSMSFEMKLQEKLN